MTQKDPNISYQLNTIKFGFYTPEEISRISIKPITHSKVYDDLNYPVRGSLADPALGVGAFDRDSNCEICNQNSENCTGHFGHIELQVPLYNPFELNNILKLLNAKCFNCDKLKMNKKDVLYLFFKLFLIKIGLLQEAKDLHEIMYESFGESCDKINRKILKFVKENLCINKNYFDTLDFNTNEENSSLNTTENEDENDDNNNNKKKNNKKKTNNNNEDKLNNIKKLSLKVNKIFFKEICNKINDKLEYINETKGKEEIYNVSLTSNDLIEELKKEFWILSKNSKCQNCGASSMKYKKVNNVRFFKILPSEKEKKRMIKNGIDFEKDSLENGAGFRMNKKREKNKEKIIKKNEDNINEFKINNNNQMNIDESNLNEEISSSFSDDENIDKNYKKDKNNSLHFNNNQKFLPCIDVLESIKKLFENDSGFLHLLFGNLKYNPLKSNNNNDSHIEIISSAPNMFFLKNLIVPPNRFRPENSTLENGDFLHQQTSTYVKIINLNADIIQLSLKLDEKKIEDPENNKNNRNTSNFEDLITKWIQLQGTVNSLFDSSKSLSKAEQEGGKGIKQLLEKKQGILRMKMMGKRVNHAGRTVISPDPLIATDEVGVPLYIASKLYFPEKVTKYNKNLLKNLIVNGTFKYPGANQIINEKNRIISLGKLNENVRKKIADEIKEGNTVFRHMQNGDILLLNRQPTLHRPSIMSHKAKILNIEKTFRLHYSNCSSYNADFDGDEMNIHFLQDEVAREEAYSISNSNNQYIVPTSGKPIRGLLQDSIDSLIYLTKKSTFFTKEEFFELIYISLEKSLNTHLIKKIEGVQPCILKPKILFSGKQLISTIIKSLATSDLISNNNITLNFEHNNRLGKEIWGKGNELEGKVIVKENELLTGVLDKNEIGASDYGLFHSFYEIFGGDLTGEFITIIGKLGVHYFQMFHGFTCSVSDVLLNDATNLKRRVDIEKILMKGIIALGKLIDVKDLDLEFDNYSNRSVYTTNKKKENEIINNIKNISNEDRNDIKEIVKLQEMKLDHNLFEHYSQKNLTNNNNNNNIFNNSYSKIKEIRDKYEQIILKDSSLDINVDTVVKNALNKETRNVPKNWLEKGLVFPFPENCFAMMVKGGSKGSVVNHTLVTCMLGQQELEGRRAPRMASGKTLPSFSAFDPNPRSSGYITDRFSTGIRPQEFFFHCMAGREGLIDTTVKTSRSGYLQRCLMKHLENLIVNYDYTVRDNDGNVIQFYYGEDSIDTINTKYLMNFKFIADNFDTYVNKFKPERLENVIDTKSVKNAIKNKEIGINETMLNKFEPWKYLGSISEKVYEKMHEYILNDPDNKFKSNKNDNNKNNEDNNNNKNKISRSKFKNIIFLKYLTSLIQPGESVGVLAAESIGEPSTQMTLNTFHLAGNGAANVTLGIPRLREILMTSEKNIKTPIMILPFKNPTLDNVKKLARKFENYKLIDIIKSINIKQGIQFNNNNNDLITDKIRNYNIEILIENINNIKNYFEYTKKELISILKGDFLYSLARKISRFIRIANGKNEISINKAMNDDIENNNNNNNDDDDDQETNTEKYETKKKNKRNNDDDEDTDNNIDDEDEDDSEEEEENEQTYDDNTTINNNKGTDEDEETFTNNTNINTNTNIDDETTNKTDNESVSNENNNNNIKNNKKIKNNQEILERTTYIYNEITFDNILFDSKPSNNKNSSLFKFDLKIPYLQKNILLKNILDNTLSNLNFKSVKNISKCHILDVEGKNNKKEYILQLEGFNYEEVRKYNDIININKISTNDIGGILNIYGIEACRSAIVKEIVNVFDVYSINVDKRHLNLIADYITFQGKYRSFSRKGISYCSSPLLKMTYETTMEFLINACENMIVDKGNTPSSRIILGRPPFCGTGCFDIYEKQKE